jgi:hypothetical protein
MTLLGGTRNPTRGSLKLRKGDGKVVVEGDPPELHEFPRKFLDRELNSAVRIRVEIPSDPPLYYEISAITGKDGNLVGTLLPTPKVKPRRRWWQRRKNHG